MSEGPPGLPHDDDTPGSGVNDEGWESRAAQWLAWARTPEFDAYWSYRDVFFALVPAPAGRTLEVGCGEGRVARDLAARGHRVTALDASPTLLRAAAERDPQSEYVLGSAEALPFADASFDLVVAYNVLIDVEDMPRAVREAARVLSPGGRMCVCVPHPVADAGRWTSDAGDSPFVIDGSYLAARSFTETIERDGLEMTFDGMAYPLVDYARALEHAGLLIEAIREPAPAAGATAGAEGAGWARWHRIPMFLMLRALKPRVVQTRGRVGAGR
jgi:SAM-dependent methyltransferase